MSEHQNDTIRIGVNGFGRIGRTVFRAALEDDRVEIVGINDVMENDDMAYLAKYDTVMGRHDGVDLVDGELVVEDAGFSAPLYGKMNPEELPWGERDVDVAFECTGIFRTYDSAHKYLEAGADKVLVSAPPKGDKPIPQLVYGVNHDEYDGEDIVSNASCTTNSITPVAKVLDGQFGIEAGQLFFRAAGYQVGYDTSPEMDLFDRQWETNMASAPRSTFRRSSDTTARISTSGPTLPGSSPQSCATPMRSSSRARWASSRTLASRSGPSRCSKPSPEPTVSRSSAAATPPGRSRCTG